MKSMKMSAAEAESYGPSTVMTDPPEYPYGLQVTLYDEAIKKLGLSEMPAVGEKMTLLARVEVCRTEQNDSVGGGRHRCLSLQITDMALGPDEAAKSPAEVLYSEGK